MAASILAESGASEEATRLPAGKWELTAPSHWKAEFCNVLWKAVCLRRIAAEEIDGIVSRVSALPMDSVDIAELWRGAVARAVIAGHPAYDTLLVELAIRLGTIVASFDQCFQSRFPSLVRSPAAILQP